MSDIEWLKLHFDNLVGDDPGYSEVEWAVTEIERLTAENERLKAFISDRIHDATRERMLMEINYRESHE